MIPGAVYSDLSSRSVSAEKAGTSRTPNFEPVIQHTQDLGTQIHTFGNAAVVSPNRVTISGQLRSFPGIRSGETLRLLGGGLQGASAHFEPADSSLSTHPHILSSDIPLQVRMELERLRGEISELRGEMEHNQRFNDDESLPSYRT